jgi:energy-coupling factor transporter ATP-binding protein EcfA2
VGLDSESTGVDLSRRYARSAPPAHLFGPGVHLAAKTDMTVDAPQGPADAGLAARARHVAALAERCWALVSTDSLPRERARQLRDHVRSYVIPRAVSLDAPLLVLLLGSTGAGKSSLLNGIAGAPISATGVLRPTTRDAVLLATSEDAALLLNEGSLSTLPRARLDVSASPSARPGLAIVDAPDLDSVERDNRVLADQLVEAADLCLFVTTATRYADQVPWDVLGRVRERGLPLLVVVNRLPRDAEDREAVLEDVRRLLAASSLTGIEDGAIEVIGIEEGDIDRAVDGLRRSSIEPVLTRIDALSADRAQRRRLAERALAGAIAGLGTLVNGVADDLERAAAEAEALRRLADTAYAERLRALLDELRSGRFLREEVLRHWHDFVRADQITRFFSSGIGRISGTLLALFRGTPAAPVAVVEKQTASDIIAIAISHANEAARRTASQWSNDLRGARLIASDAALWSASGSFAERLEPRLKEWVAQIASDVQARGASKRSLTFGASLGINALGVAVMLGVFSHTAGLTGAEVGIAAATAFLNQKLLEALFGEAAMTEMIERARSRLETLLGEVWAEEKARFERQSGSGEDLRLVARDLRASVQDIAA